MQNTEERLSTELEGISDSMERIEGFSQQMAWFRLAALAVKCLILIVSWMWDQEHETVKP